MADVAGRSEDGNEKNGKVITTEAMCLKCNYIF
jgi:hypothetical protein